MKKNPSLSWQNVFIGLVVIVVTAVAASGLWIAGSPAKERARNLDARRVSDLQTITNAVDQYYNANAKTLPPNLEAVLNVRDMYYVSSIKDPETDLTYEYLPKSKDQYDLCASFTTDSKEMDRVRLEPYQPTNTFWVHGVGRTCYTITARDFQAPPIK